jgi:hypothetical protein
MTLQRRKAMSMIRLYGPTRGNGSWPRVVAGMRRGLAKIGKLASFCSTDEIGHQLDDALEPGYDAPVGVHFGPPTIASVMQGHGMHRHRLAMIATNSSWVPTDAMLSLERESITGYVGTSPWSSDVLRTHTKLPVLTCLLGVSEAFAPANVDPPDGFRVLHMASTAAERKGTSQLIHAWTRCLIAGSFPVKGSMLRLVCDGPPGFFDQAIRDAIGERAELAGTYVVSPRLDLTEREACMFYQGFHLVCQPSRAEGFGMVPLEARASGVPVVMTNGSGHNAHAFSGLGRGQGVVYEGIDSPPGVIIVPVQGACPIDDGPGALAPAFDTNVLAGALALGYERLDELTEHARRQASWIGQQWSWARVCEQFVESAKRDLT